jgi:hypothetical protein
MSEGRVAVRYGEELWRSARREGKQTNGSEVHI